jgi:hypothetical protein
MHQSKLALLGTRAAVTARTPLVLKNHLANYPQKYRFSVHTDHYFNPVAESLLLVSEMANLRHFGHPFGLPGWVGPHSTKPTKFSLVKSVRSTLSRMPCDLSNAEDTELRCSGSFTEITNSLPMSSSDDTHICLLQP